MKVYLKGLILGLHARVQYRANLLLSVIFWNLSLAAVLPFWFLVYRGHADIAKMSLSDVVTYTLLVRVAGAAAMISVAYRIGVLIRDGGLSGHLLLPTNLHAKLYMEALGGKLIEVAATLMLLLALLPFLSMNVSRPATEAGPILFLAALLLGSVISYAIGSLIGATAFWFQEIFAIIWCASVMMNLASGQVIPIGFFPGRVAAATRLLPFASFGDFPAQLYLG
jgi:ABC-2 type transport system permease protein